VELLERKTVRVEIDGVNRYATPLLRVKDMPELRAPKEAVLSHLRATERRLIKNPEQANAYTAEISKLEQAGYVSKLPQSAEPGVLLAPGTSRITWCSTMGKTGSSSIARSNITDKT